MLHVKKGVITDVGNTAIYTFAITSASGNRYIYTAAQYIISYINIIIYNYSILVL